MKVKLLRGKVVDGKKCKVGDGVEVDSMTVKQLIYTKAAEPADAEARKAAAKLPADES